VRQAARHGEPWTADAGEPKHPAPIRALLGWLVGLWAVACLAAGFAWRWTRRGAGALWRSLRPYGTASWRHPPRGA
jgi:hypothetical protein